MDIIKTSDFFVRKEGVWVTALGGLVLHVCASFIANRHYNARIQTDKGQRSVRLVCPGMKRVLVWYQAAKRRLWSQEKHHQHTIGLYLP